MAGDLKAKSFETSCRSRFLIFSKAIRSHHLGFVPFSFSFNLFSSLHADPPCAPPFRCSQAAGGDFLACTKALGPYEVLTFLQPFTPLQTIPHQGGWWGSVSSTGRGGVRQRGGTSKPDTGSGKSWEVNGFVLWVRNDQPEFTSKNSHLGGLWECHKESKCSLEHVPSCHFSHAGRLGSDVRVC